MGAATQEEGARPAARGIPARGKVRLGFPIRRLRGLRVQLLLWTILPLAVALIVLSFAGVFRHRQVMRQMVEDRDRSLALAEANSLARVLERRSSLLAGAADMLANSPAPAQADLDRLAALLGDNFADGLALLDDRGALLTHTGTPQAPWLQLPQVQALADQARTGQKPQFAAVRTEDRASGGSAPVTVLLAVPAPANRALVASAPLSQLGLAEVSQHLGTETGGAVFLLDDAGQTLYSSTPPALAIDPAGLAHAVRMAQTGNVSMPMQDMALHGTAGGPAGFTYLQTKGQPDLLVAYAPVDPLGWTLVTAEDVAQMVGSALSVAEVLPMILLFVAVLALLAVSFGAAAIVRPLQELDRRAARVAWGEFDAIEEPVGGIQEIDDLRDTLSQMAGRVRSYQAGMRDYLSATTQAQEEERSRLAHELHDDTVQALIALKQRAQMARKALTGDPARAAARLDELEGLIDQELTGLRRLIGDLRPIYLEDLGFVPALEMLAQQMQVRHGLQVEFEVQGEPARLSPDLELAAYRIVQQALANVIAHAGAKHAAVNVTFSPDSVTLSVSDDGQGFTPPDQPADLARRGHYGLMGMRERAVLYGGHLTVTSAPGQGTTVQAHLPLC